MFLIILNFIYIVVALFAHYLTKLTVVDPLELPFGYLLIFDAFILFCFFTRFLKGKLIEVHVFKWILVASMAGFSFLSFYLPMAVFVLIYQLLFSYSPQLSIGLVIVSVLVTIHQYISVHYPKLVYHEIPLPKKLASYDGLKVLHLSDLHIGPILKNSFLSRILKRVADLHIDFTCITGDLVDGPVSSYAKELAPLETLAARHPVYFVTGNHEAYYQPFDWLAEIEKRNCKVLREEVAEFNYNGATVHVAGADDPYFARVAEAKGQGKPSLNPEMPDDELSMLLAHNPNVWLASENHPYFLQLSGHTHGGQAFPFRYLVSKFNKYFKGMYEEGGKYLYVHTGTGFWGPPNRLFVPPIIVIHEFKLT